MIENIIELAENKVPITLKSLKNTFEIISESNKIAIILVIQHFFRYLAKNKRETDKKTWRNKK